LVLRNQERAGFENWVCIGVVVLTLLIFVLCYVSCWLLIVGCQKVLPTANN